MNKWVIGDQLGTKVRELVDGLRGWSLGLGGEPIAPFWEYNNSRKVEKYTTSITHNWE